MKVNLGIWPKVGNDFFSFVGDFWHILGKLNVGQHGTGISMNKVIEV